MDNGENESPNEKQFKYNDLHTTEKDITAYWERLFFHHGSKVYSELVLAIVHSNCKS